VRPAIRIRVDGVSHPGKVRAENQDRLLMATLRGRGRVLAEGGGEGVLESEPGAVLLLVADGMGGAAGGALASRLAAESVFDQLVRGGFGEPGYPPESLAWAMRQALEGANQMLFKHASAIPALHGMGTTMTAAGVVGEVLILAQVGDSRAYLVREGETVQLTRDQSLLQHLVDSGQLTPEEAEQSGRRNVILQALGPTPGIVVDLSRQRLCRGDALVLCSDGLSGVVRREEIGLLVAEDRDPSRICEDLVALANERGAPDNVTVVVARFDGEGLAEPDEGDSVGYRSLDLEG